MKKKGDFTYLFSIAILALIFMLSLNGCGTDGGKKPPNGSQITDDNKTKDENGTGNEDNTSNPGVHSKFKYRKISIAGSSITHGNIADIKNDGEGYLGEYSYVGEVEKYFREEVADTIGPDKLKNAFEEIDEPMSYKGKLMVYDAGTVISGTLESSKEIAVVYAGTNVPTVIQMQIDGDTYDYTIPRGNYLPVKKVFNDISEPFYKAFRETNPKAVKVWNLSSDKQHSFSLTVKSGKLRLNFITNHMYYIQNAGVGGFEALDFLSENRQHSTVDDIIAFDPDLFIFESSTNDAKTWLKDHNKTDGEDSTNSWIIENPISFYTSGKTIYLTQAISVKKGDIVIIGEYNGDIENMVVGIVSQDIANSRNITLSKIVSYKDKTVKELNSIPSNIVKKCRIKSIKEWEDRVIKVISKLKKGVDHGVEVGIATSGVPNYYKPGSNPPLSEPPNTPRRLLGYREKAEILAKENGWFFVDFFKHTLAVEPGVDVNKKWSWGDNTHPNDKGRVIFGDAVIEALESL